MPFGAGAHCASGAERVRYEGPKTPVSPAEMLGMLIPRMWAQRKQKGFARLWRYINGYYR
jgi:hypothetical protein